MIGRAGEVVARRSLDFYEAVALRLAGTERPSMTARADPNGSVLDRIKRTLVGLRMPRALEMIDATVRQLEQGELSPLEAIEGLLAEEFSIRESRRIKTALVMARLVDHQDARRLRLHLPAVARPQPRPGPRPARLRRPP